MRRDWGHRRVPQGKAFLTEKSEDSGAQGGWASPLPVPTVVSKVNVQADRSFLERQNFLRTFPEAAPGSGRVSTADSALQAASPEGGPWGTLGDVPALVSVCAWGLAAEWVGVCGV